MTHVMAPALVRGCYPRRFTWYAVGMSGGLPYKTKESPLKRLGYTLVGP